MATLDAVLNHLFPTEPGIPGAREIKALDYLGFVTSDPKIDKSERDLILKGAPWVDSLSRKLEDAPFIELDHEHRERVLRRMAQNIAGELWISTLLIYILEALLAAPAYGVNPNGIGWKWLKHTPGYPLPGPETIYPRLKL
jgi:gluconate 2-dehydrogenase gamma chain